MRRNESAEEKKKKKLLLHKYSQEVYKSIRYVEKILFIFLTHHGEKNPVEFSLQSRVIKEKASYSE